VRNELINLKDVVIECIVLQLLLAPHSAVVNNLSFRLWETFMIPNTADNKVIILMPVSESSQAIA